jgi:hypothetical protein
MEIIHLLQAGPGSQPRTMNRAVLAIAIIAWLSMLVLPLMVVRKRRRREAVLAEKLRQFQMRANEETGVRPSDPR